MAATTGAGKESPAGGVRQTTRDGVPVVWIPGSDDGRITAELTFRVGTSDETLASRGITHMVEHLVLHQVGQAPHASNGETASVWTSVNVTGTPDEVCRHLRAVCEALSDLDTERLPRERTVLASEAAQAGGGATRSLLAMRWGPNGCGLNGYDEVGLRRLTGSDLHEWAATRFTSGNAILAVRGNVPRGLRLPLGDGPVNATREVGPPVIDLPATYSYSRRGVGLSYVLPRTYAATALTSVLYERLQNRVRFDLGLSYGVRVGIDRLSIGEAHHALWLDSLPENAREVQNAVADVLREFFTEPITAEELTEFRGSASQPRGALEQRLAYVALCKLFGTQAQSEASLAAEIRRLSVAGVTGLAETLHASLLIAAPFPRSVPGDLVRQMPVWSDDVLQGTPSVLARTASLRQGTSLVVTSSGASLVFPAGKSPVQKAVTVMYDACAAVLSYDDGTRTLIGNDGFTVTVASEDWAGFDALRDRIDRGVDPGIVVPSGPREPEPPRVAGDAPSAEPVAAAKNQTAAATLSPGRRNQLVKLLLCALFVCAIVGSSISIATGQEGAAAPGIAIAVLAGRNLLYRSGKLPRRR